jgi:UDP-N-acetylmuramyl pentapeptide phosphotransferase/UDP-N-acetylglucosamine-1-phosphate transferase
MMKSDFIALFEPSLMVALLISAIGCMVLIKLAEALPLLAGRIDDTNAVQSMHQRLTPRIGGIATFAAFAASFVFVPTGIAPILFTLITASFILFLVGLREDLGVPVSPKVRLLTIVAASLWASVSLGIWIDDIGAPMLDVMLSSWFVGIPFTLLITAGVTNGFNLIDGVNGLAAGTAISAAVAIALIAQQAGLPDMAVLSMTLAATTAGFFIINYPFGYIFLGDAGAYTIGFLLSWIGVIILALAPAVSPWAILLTLFWPLADTLLAMYRRSRGNRSAMLPDRLHFHQLVMRAIEIMFLGRNKRALSNPLTTIAMLPFIIAPQVAAILLWNDNFGAFLAVLLFLAAFAASYGFGLSLVHANRRRYVSVGAK